MIDGLLPYRQYKCSALAWLGMIPAHWREEPGFGLFREKQDKNVGLRENRVLSLSYGRVVIRPEKRLHGLVPGSFETYQIVDPGDLVIRGTDLQNDWTSARVGLVRDRGIITSAYLCFRNFGFSEPDYAYLILHAYDIRKFFYGLGSGLRQNLSFGDFRRLPFPVPPSEEQSAIVRFLDYANRQIGRYLLGKRKLIALLNEQKQAIIHRAVTQGMDPSVPMKCTGMRWLEMIPAHWEVRPFLRSIIERADYRGATPEKVGSGIFLITAKNIREGWIDYECSREFVRRSEYARIMRRGLPRIGDIVLTTEAPLGHVALLDREDIALAQRIIRFRADPHLLLPKYALHCIGAPYFQHQLHERATGSTAQGIKASKLPQLTIALPPKEEQHDIVLGIEESCRPLNAALSSAAKDLQLMGEYRTRLISDIVTGQLDVREAARALPDEADEAPAEVGELEETLAVDEEEAQDSV